MQHNIMFLNIVSDVNSVYFLMISFYCTHIIDGTSTSSSTTTTSTYCEYHLDSDVDVKLTTSADIGSIVATLRILRRGGGSQSIEFNDDLYFPDNSTYFQLNLDDGRMNMILTNCLTAGQIEVVYVAIGRRIDTLQECDPTTFTISVVPTRPIITRVDNFIGVHVNKCDSTDAIPVHRISFKNAGECIKFNCSVRCENHAKNYWMDKDYFIHTDINDIDYNDEHILDVICVENSSMALANQDSYASETRFKVYFTTDGPCLTGTRITSSSLRRSVITSNQNINKSLRATDSLPEISSDFYKKETTNVRERSPITLQKRSTRFLNATFTRISITRSVTSTTALRIGTPQFQIGITVSLISTTALQISTASSMINAALSQVITTPSVISRTHATPLMTSATSYLITTTTPLVPLIKASNVDSPSVVVTHTSCLICKETSKKNVFQSSRNPVLIASSLALVVGATVMAGLCFLKQKNMQPIRSRNI